jgi:ArsR family transcriptional regulator
MKDQTEQIREAAKMLRVIAHPVRLEIIRLLHEQGEINVGRIQAALSLTQSMTSQHLTALRNVGIVYDRKESNVKYYGIKNKEVLKLLSCLQNCCR